MQEKIAQLKQNPRRVALYGIGGLLVLFILIQLIPLSRTNPEVTSEFDWGSPEAKNIAQGACYDCHSNETVWAWYSKIAPVSWLVGGHVKEGREHLNFSEWSGNSRDLREMIEVIDEGEMPTWDYELMHADARLSDEQKAILIDALKQIQSQTALSSVENNT